MIASNTFLSEEDLRALTGRKQPRRQVEALRTMAVPFYVNAIGHPVVARSTIEGRPGSAAEHKPIKGWSPNALKAGVSHGQKTNRQSRTTQGHARPGAA